MSAQCYELTNLIKKYFTDCDATLATHIQYFNPRRFLNLDPRKQADFLNDYRLVADKYNKEQLSGYLNLGERIEKYFPVIFECEIKYNLEVGLDQKLMDNFKVKFIH